MEERYEELGWCPMCGQSKWHEYRSDPEQGWSLDEIAEILSNITLKDAVGEPLTESEKMIVGFTLNSSHSMENRYGTYMPVGDEE